MATASLLRANWARPSLKLLPCRGSTTYQGLRKSFSTTIHRNMLTSELSEAEVSALRVDKERLAEDLHHSCQWGSGIRWGE
jgi:hypothetical protein